ncbi:LysR family transcriptional regulator [Cognatishimia maritima]|nr:LysR family transcriptional regulator [Cognatishimia maritima]
MRVFRTVIECSGLSAAQIELGVGASTISRQLSDLETRLGIRLCHRGRGGFSLTQQGELALEHIDRLLAAAEEFSTNIAAINNELVGQINIGMIDYTVIDTRNPLVPAISAFRERAPEVNVSLMTGTPTEVERGVMDGKLHIGIVPDYQRHPSLNYAELYDEEVGLYCAANHPIAAKLQAGEDISESQVTKHALVHRGYFESDRLRALKQHFPVGTVAYQTEAVMALVGFGLYLGFFPAHCKHTAQFQFLEVLPDVFGFSTPIMAIWRRDRNQSQILQEFLDLVLNSKQRTAV